MNRNILLGISIGMGLIFVFAFFLPNSNQDDIYFLNSGSSGNTTDTTECGNVGSGNTIHIVGSNCNAKSLITGNGIAIANTGVDLTISARPPFAVMGHVDETRTFTNLPTTYTDVYIAAFTEENRIRIDCLQTNLFQINYQWDFIGSGTDRLRWVDPANNANILYEDATISADQDPNLNSFIKPIWCTSSSQAIEMQALSSNGTNDPISHGYIILGTII